MKIPFSFAILLASGDSFSPICPNPVPSKIIALHPKSIIFFNKSGLYPDDILLEQLFHLFLF